METLFTEIEENLKTKKHLEFLKDYFNYVPEVGKIGQFNNTTEKTLDNNTYYVKGLPFRIIKKLENDEWIVQCDLSYDLNVRNLPYNKQPFKIHSTGIWFDVYERLQQNKRVKNENY